VTRSLSRKRRLCVKTVNPICKSSVKKALFRHGGPGAGGTAT